MRRGLALILACGLVLASAAVVYLLVFRDDPVPVPMPVAPAPRPAPPPIATPSVPAVTFEIAEVTGAVEVRRHGAWAAARRGERVGRGDALRTADDGRVVLRTPGGDELALRERVDLEVEHLGETVTELKLNRGKVNAAAAPHTERLRIASAGAQAVGSHGDRFTVYADPRGAVTVASETGDVKVLAQGAEVTVAAGAQTHVPPGGTPTDPVPIPADVFLAVAWPGRALATTRVAVRGRVMTGSQVKVNGESAVVLDDGAFEAQVNLREGRNFITVTAETVDGRTSERGLEVLVNTKGPPLAADPTKMFEPPKPKP